MHVCPEPLRVAITQLQQENASLRNLLATVHRDGGHRVNEVGIEQAVEEAIKEWGRTREALENIGAGMCLYMDGCRGEDNPCWTCIARKALEPK